jgi:GT2 family glycosyltransferase
LPIAFNDVDCCLRVVESGKRVVYTPYATLVHHESVTKTVFAEPSEIGRLRARWGRFIDHDPFYNPNLTRKAEDASLRMD